MVFSQDHENYEKLFDDIEKRIAEEIRKETAEKFAERLRYKYIDFDDYDELYVKTIREEIDEICKEITEGKDDDTSQVGK
jgi:DNA invertase Pin-like site-specific DNA recombinase